MVQGAAVEDGVLTISEVAKRLNTSIHTVYRLTSAGDLPYVDLGPCMPNRKNRMLRVRPIDLEQFIYKRTKCGK